MSAASRAAVRQELATLQVFGETAVGWDAATPVNETVDEHGSPLPEQRGFGVPDPRAPGARVYDHPEVQRLREALRECNGIRGLEICAPNEVERAVRIFRRDGFVVVRDLLDAEHLARFRRGSARALRQILEVPGPGERKYMTESGRLPHRYSYGTSSASRQMLHEDEWASMVDLPTTTPILAAIFGGMDYHVLGAGGDLCLPGAVEYQHLHADVAESNAVGTARVEAAKALGIDIRTADGGIENATRRRIVDFTPPVVTINFAMCDLTWENGPIRQIPGSHAWPMRPTPPAEEPAWMRFSTLVGAPAGAGVFRDNRAWHGATPNLSREIRALPNVEYGALWLPERDDTPRTMPHDVWETLTPHGKRICRRIKAPPGVWPAGAGAMHPLGAERRAAAKRMGGSGERRRGSPGG